jgi:hypothetical protein
MEQEPRLTFEQIYAALETARKLGEISIGLPMHLKDVEVKSKVIGRLLVDRELC